MSPLSAVALTLVTKRPFHVLPGRQDRRPYCDTRTDFLICKGQNERGPGSFPGPLSWLISPINRAATQGLGAGNQQVLTATRGDVAVGRAAVQEGDGSVQVVPDAARLHIGGVVVNRAGIDDQERQCRQRRVVAVVLHEGPTAVEACHVGRDAAVPER